MNEYTPASYTFSQFEIQMPRPNYKLLEELLLGCLHDVLSNQKLCS